jgi:uncharacterized protein YyaL (SSP411 family)
VQDKEANSLINETSPYLLQHAYNPVNWYSWEKGLDIAKEEDKPLLISIGYAACHWCHVMERESFEDSETAAIMNEYFINIKIDREERPDLDASYQKAVARLSRGQGGWPLTVFATPEGNAFAGGTYFPKENSYGLPAFKHVLQYIIKEYKTKPDLIDEITTETVSALTDLHSVNSLPIESNKIQEVKEIILGRLSKQFDQIFGGFGFQPKFPQVTDLRFLLYEGLHPSQNKTLLNMVTKTLDNLADGGIYDHIGYGFHRYSVDRKWLIPHFEKMLYDNAQLLLLYLEAYQVTGKQHYVNISEEIIEYLLREMRSSEGLFFSSQDADSEGKEGAFYIWKQNEILDTLGLEDGKRFNQYFDISSDGNFEDGYSVIHATPSLYNAFEQGVITKEIVLEWKQKLLSVRMKRPKPLLNDNVIVSWNALVVFALSQASFILKKPEYLEIAQQTLDFITNSLTDERTGRLRRNYRLKANGWGFADDYALIIQDYILLFGLTGKRTNLDKALLFQEILDKHFWDKDGLGYYFSGSWMEDIFIREKPVVTFSIPNSNSVSLENLIRLYHYTGNQEYLNKAENQAAFLLGWFKENNHFNGETVNALNLFFEKPIEMVIFWSEKQDPEDSILDFLRSTVIPNLLILNVTKANYEEVKNLALVKDRVNGSNDYPFKETTVFICKNLTCSLPLHNRSEIQAYFSTNIGISN